MTKNGVEFLIGWRDFPLDKDDRWEPIIISPGSEHMITTVISTTSGKKSYPERLFSSAGLVESDLWGSLLDTTLIDVM